ncbi:MULTISPECIES: response regulator transcription factor [unclassified Salinibacterium]|uniref:response regulator transcription factor n=1 Tax=unclassified Salinibacterium TaxID=2632331 RepID=UPI0018CF5822|nr:MULTISPECIES: response regulator [unclassified Salinibacterium]MBH0052828.1 response regulator [Salinibacterium sp. SWN139]MBH0082089.1 response regulator [Salinibacterium sp. SWN167]
MAVVLIVEDDEDVRALVVHRMKQAGHEVHTEHDGEAGLGAARASIPDLVILDWMMPRRNGLEVCFELRADPLFAATRILMLTAKAQEQDIERALAAGADDYVVKPFSSRELLARANALLSR